MKLRSKHDLARVATLSELLALHREVKTLRKDELDLHFVRPLGHTHAENFAVLDLQWFVQDHLGGVKNRR